MVQAVQSAALEHDASFAMVRGSGVIEDAVILRGGSDRHEPRAGLSDVISLTGHVVRGSGAYQARLYVLLVQGTQLIGGQLVRGHARSIAMTLECLDGVRLTVPTAEPVNTLGDAARALETTANAPDPTDAEEPPSRPEPEAGDLLEHPSFGVVELESEGDSGRVKIKLGSGSMREIMLDVFEVLVKEPRDGKRLFALRPRRR